MITKHLTSVSLRFNPFTLPGGKTARVFLASLPPNALSSGELKVSSTLLPKNSREGSVLGLKFKDGKEMKLDLEKLNIKEVMNEVDRHSRGLSRKEELSGN